MPNRVWASRCVRADWRPPPACHAQEQQSASWAPTQIAAAALHIRGRLLALAFTILKLTSKCTSHATLTADCFLFPLPAHASLVPNLHESNRLAAGLPLHQIHAPRLLQSSVRQAYSSSWMGGVHSTLRAWQGVWYVRSHRHVLHHAPAGLLGMWSAACVVVHVCIAQNAKCAAAPYSD
jgi:hypothetical protein